MTTDRDVEVTGTMPVWFAETVALLWRELGACTCADPLVHLHRDTDGGRVARIEYEHVRTDCPAVLAAEVFDPDDE